MQRRNGWLQIPKEEIFMKNMIFTIILLLSFKCFAQEQRVKWSLRDLPKVTISCGVTMRDLYSGPQSVNVILIERGVPAGISSSMTLYSYHFLSRRACQGFLDKNRSDDWKLIGTYSNHRTQECSVAEKKLHVKVQGSGDMHLDFDGSECRD
jgi:hypothetical protein